MNNSSYSPYSSYYGIFNWISFINFDFSLTPLSTNDFFTFCHYYILLMEDMTKIEIEIVFILKMTLNWKHIG